MIRKVKIIEGYGCYGIRGQLFSTSYEVDFNKNRIVCERKNDIGYVAYKEIAQLPILDPNDIFSIQNNDLDKTKEMITDLMIKHKDEHNFICDVMPTSIKVYFDDKTPIQFEPYLDECVMEVIKNLKKIINKMKNISY